MTSPSDFDVTEAMIVFGGSFASQLGKLYRLADATNQQRLRDAFADVWGHYSDPLLHARLAQLRQTEPKP